MLSSGHVAGRLKAALTSDAEETRLPKVEYHSLARRGAELRVSEIEEEIRAIMSAFPDLHRSDIAPSSSSAVHGRALREIIPGDRRRGPRSTSIPRVAPDARATARGVERRKATRS